MFALLPTTRTSPLSQRIASTGLLIACLMASSEAIAELENARLTDRGQEFYAKKFTLGGRVNAGSHYLLRSAVHPRDPGVYALAGFDMTYAGLRLGQSLSRLEQEYEYRPQLEYNHAWSSWDIQLSVVARIHLEKRLKNFIEYGLASGVRFGSNRIALHITRVQDENPHFALEIAHEWNIRGVFHWQNLIGAEQGRLMAFLGNVIAGQSNTAVSGIASSRRWFPYAQSILLVDFSREESWNPVFEVGVYLNLDNLEEFQYLFIWNLRLNF